MKFNENMTMGEILQANPNTQAVLEGFGMHCCGCPVCQAEELKDACDAHGIDVALVLQELNKLNEVFVCDCCSCNGGEYCTCEDDDCNCDDDCDCGCKE